MGPWKNRNFQSGTLLLVFSSTGAARKELMLFLSPEIRSSSSEKSPVASIWLNLEVVSVIFLDAVSNRSEEVSRAFWICDRSEPAEEARV